jgi:zinc transport system ATP-binding protein
MRSDVALTVSRVSFSYGNHQVLEDISLQINAGDFIFFTGANGSGKSTLAKLVLNLLPLKKGDIKINRQRVSQALVAKYCGYVPQYADIDRDFPLSVEELIRFECDAANSDCPSDPATHLQQLNSEYLLKRRISQLSGGEMQKVLIARSLVKEPDILILDEPVNNLDEQAEKNLFALLEDLNRSGITVVVIIHDHNTILEIESARTFLFQNKSAREIDAKSELHQHEDIK